MLGVYCEPPDVTNVPLTEGDINWGAVMKSLDENGYEGSWATLEVAGGGLEHFKDVSARLDKILAM